MVPPAGSRSSRLPSLAWESVVDDDPVSPDHPSAPEPSPFGADATTPLIAPAPIAEHSRTATPPEPAPLPADVAPAAIPSAPIPPMSMPLPSASSPIEEITFTPLTLDIEPILLAPAARTATVEQRSAPAPEPVTRPAPEPAVRPASDPAVRPASELAPERPRSVMIGPPAVSAPPDVTAAEPSNEIPTIVEATPVPDVAPLVDAPFEAGPRLPRTQPETAPAAVAPVHVHVAPTTTLPVRRHRKKTRRGFKLAFTLVVLGAVVAAAVVFGRPYLFPGEWDVDTRPFADAIETASGLSFGEPIVLGTETPEAFSTRMVGELAGEWADDQPAWRALGLLTGTATPLTVEVQLADWQSAVYSTEDGQVYRREGAADVAVAGAVAVALLDQVYRWSIGQADRTLDDRVLTLAAVRRQADAIVANSILAEPVAPVVPTVVPFVPPVLGYQVLAPAVFAEFGVDDAERPLAGIGAGGPGPLRSEAPAMAPSPMMIGTDTLVGSPQARDRSFWFLVFAGLLDPTSAYRASEAVVESAVSVADRSGSTCVYSTFAGGDVAQTATLRTALETWSATAPAAFGATFAVLGDGTLQLVSCDPGAGSEQPLRLGVAQELIAWRTAELATIEAVRAFGGGDADVDAAWAIVEASTVGADLAALPSGTSPEATAAAARAAIVELFAPQG
jgi:hypothetical protein